MKYELNWDEYAKVARQMAAEGCVLVKNDGGVLPLKSDEKIAVFGRLQTDYIKSGTGSGGMVNAPYVVSIMDALQETSLVINEEVRKVYADWIKENPYDKGIGWATEPWSQVEMKLPEGLAKSAAGESDVALIVLGRTAGEDKDNSATKGSYYLTDEEELLLENVCEEFDKVVVVLNVGNIIDMSFVDKYEISSVLYVWQGGAEGGHGAVDVLTGKVDACGRLSDTIANDISDYPSTKNFGDPDKNYYEEDIYIGYRYFETAAKDKVRYPFGYGLSYTKYDYSYAYGITEFDEFKIDVSVKNIGKRPGKDVIQIYCEPPQGALCKPIRNLVAFTKTDIIEPGKSENLTITFDIAKMASFDDSGATGHKDCMVCEAGEYVIYAGANVRDAAQIGSFNLANTIVVETLEEACSPVDEFDRMVIDVTGDKPVIKSEKVPVRSYDLAARIAERRPENRDCTGDKGYRFADVVKGDVKVNDFLDQLEDEDLICMTRGEGMCSPKVTPGIAGSFGGVTERLNRQFGMPVAGCSDGPSGIRMDCGTEAMALPSGTLQACTFNTALIEKLYEFEALELRKNGIDSLLGPGINIHRNPLNGRNFEYYSEDPYLTGACAVAELRGLHKYNVTGTCKHFATNNQETSRHFVDAAVSGRALREIYFKPFEMAVKQGGAYLIMTTYGPLNNIWTGGNYDLATTVLRKEWGFKGLVMTDWWAKLNEDGSREANIRNTTALIRSQNDVYMVTADSATNANNDNSAEGLKAGKITRGELLRNAANICYALAKSPVGIELVEEKDEIVEINKPEGSGRELNLMPSTEITEEGDIVIEGLNTDAGVEDVFRLRLLSRGRYTMTMRVRSTLGELSQTSFTVYENKKPLETFTLKGNNMEWEEKSVTIEAIAAPDNYMSIYFAQSGIEVDNIHIKFVEAVGYYEEK